MKAVLGVLAVSGALLAVPLAAQTSADHASHHPDPKAPAAATPMSDGEVRNVDKARARSRSSTVRYRTSTCQP